MSDDQKATLEERIIDQIAELDRLRDELSTPDSPSSTHRDGRHRRRSTMRNIEAHERSLAAFERELASVVDPTSAGRELQPSDQRPS